MLAACGLLAAPARADLVVDATPLTLRTTLGTAFQIQTATRNTGAEASGAILHLNIVSLDPGTYVDPEDWSSTRTRYVDEIPPNGEVTTTWKLQAVNSGSFAVYVTALPGRTAGSGLRTSKAVRVHVTGQRSLDPGGALPLALGVPATLVLLTLGVRRHRQRS